MIDRVKITIEDVQGTNAWKETDDLNKRIHLLPHYIRAIGGWLTIGKIKGADEMLSLHHLTEFQKELLIELCENTSLA